MDNNPEPTIKISDIVAMRCDHCQADTVQVIGGAGLSSVIEGAESPPSRACLQCIADGGGCCTLKPLNRWPSEP